MLPRAGGAITPSGMMHRVGGSLHAARVLAVDDARPALEQLRYRLREADPGAAVFTAAPTIAAARAASAARAGGVALPG